MDVSWREIMSIACPVLLIAVLSEYKWPREQGSQAEKNRKSPLCPLIQPGFLLRLFTTLSPNGAQRSFQCWDNSQLPEKVKTKERSCNEFYFSYSSQVIWSILENLSTISDNGCLEITGDETETMRTEDTWNRLYFYDKHICQGHQVWWDYQHTMSIRDIPRLLTNDKEY